MPWSKDAALGYSTFDYLFRWQVIINRYQLGSTFFLLAFLLFSGFLEIWHTIQVHHEGMHNEEIVEIVWILLMKFSPENWPKNGHFRHLSAYKPNRNWTFHIYCFMVEQNKASSFMSYLSHLNTVIITDATRWRKTLHLMSELIYNRSEYWAFYIKFSIKSMDWNWFMLQIGLSLLAREHGFYTIRVLAQCYICDNYWGRFQAISMQVTDLGFCRFFNDFGRKLMNFLIKTIRDWTISCLHFNYITHWLNLTKDFQFVRAKRYPCQQYFDRTENGKTREAVSRHFLETVRF